MTRHHVIIPALAGPVRHSCNHGRAEAPRYEYMLALVGQDFAEKEFLRISQPALRSPRSNVVFPHKRFSRTVPGPL